MPTNHRGQDIGAHNHANLITERTFVYRNGEVEHTLSSPSDDMRFTAESGPSKFPSSSGRNYHALTGVHHPEGTEIDPGVTSTYADYRFGKYSTPERAEMASIAAANRYYRTGSFGRSQHAIRMSRLDRKLGK